MSVVPNLDFGPNDVLIATDCQEDFSHGALGTPEARIIMPGAAKLIKNFPGYRIFTKDTHESNYLNTQEGRRLPIVHTVRNTPGWELTREIRGLLRPKISIIDKNTVKGPHLAQQIRTAATLRDTDFIVEKDTFPGLGLIDIIRNLPDVRYIYIIGVCTGICVISNAIVAKAANPEATIYVIENLCACVTPESHKTAIQAMRPLQMQIVQLQWLSKAEPAC